MNSLARKIIVFSIIFVMLFNLTGFVESPPKAQALVVECPKCSQLWNQITGIAKDIAFYADTINKWFVDKLNLNLTDLVAKRIMDYIVDQTVQWIAGNGKPKFVSDWDGFLKTAGDIAFDTVVKKVGLARICEPFRLNVNVSLIPLPKLSQRLDCTLDRVVSNIRDFYDDFSRGGWLAYNEQWYPANNFFGNQLIIGDELLIEKAKKVEAARNEAIAGKGFLSVKECIAWDSEVLQACVDLGNSFEDCKKASCTKEKIITPGAAVGAAIENAIGSDSMWAANIRSWTALLVDALINRVIKEGISGMKSLLTGGGSGGGNEAAAYMPPQYQSLSTWELESQKQQMTSELQKFRDEEQYLLNAKNKSLSFARRTLVNLQTMQTKNCPSTLNIQSIQADITRLNNETAVLQAAIMELTTAINKVQQAANFTALSSLNQETLRVFNKYNSSGMQEQIITGSARQAADQEAQAKQNELGNSQAELDACLAPPPAESR